MRDKITNAELVSIAEKIYSCNPNVIEALATRLRISEKELQEIKEHNIAEDVPMFILLEWRKRHSVASRTVLAESLLMCGLRELAFSIDSYGEHV